jgi:hypothetical protein
MEDDKMITLLKIFPLEIEDDLFEPGYNDFEIEDLSSK